MEKDNGHYVRINSEIELDIKKILMGRLSESLKTEIKTIRTGIETFWELRQNGIEKDDALLQVIELISDDPTARLNGVNAYLQSVVDKKPIDRQIEIAIKETLAKNNPKSKHLPKSIIEIYRKIVAQAKKLGQTIIEGFGNEQNLKGGE